jgi:hypothetical protein
MNTLGTTTVESMINMSSNLDKSTMQLVVDSQPDNRVSLNLHQSWFITVRVLLEGKEMELDTIMESCLVTTSFKQLIVESMGMVDAFCAVYQVNEILPIHNLGDLSLQVSFIPKFHPTTRSLFKLDTTLAQFVGRQYLSKPKYALTLIHAYARENNLKTKSNIICDETLQIIFGRPWIKLSNTWNELSRHVKMVPGEKMMISHNLTEFAKTNCSSLEVLMDSDMNLFPVTWSLRGQGCGGGLLTKIKSEVGGRKKENKRWRKHKSL